MSFENHELKSAAELAAEGETTLEKELSERDPEIEDSGDFSTAVETGFFEAARNWLMEAKESKKYAGNDRWLDHRSGELFTKAHEAGEYALAKEMVPLASTEKKVAERRTRLEKVSGMSFDEI